MDARDVCDFAKFVSITFTFVYKACQAFLAMIRDGKSPRHGGFGDGAMLESACVKAAILC